MRKLFEKPAVRFMLFLVLMAVLMYIGQFNPFDQEKIDNFLEGTPIVYASILFVLLYIIGTFFLWYLKDPLKIVGALVFGAYLSTFLIYCSEIVNAFIFFKLSRTLGKEFIEKSLKGRFKKFYERLETFNLGWVFVLRGVPLIPYRVLDLSFGLSKYSFKKYFAAVLLVSLPRIFLIQFPIAAMRGFSVDGLMQYFLDNPLIFKIYFAYFFVAVILAFCIKRKIQ